MASPHRDSVEQWNYFQIWGSLFVSLLIRFLFWFFFCISPPVKIISPPAKIIFWSKLWYFFGWYCEIRSKLWYLADILKFGWKLHFNTVLSPEGARRRRSLPFSTSKPEPAAGASSRAGEPPSQGCVPAPRLATLRQPRHITLSMARSRLYQHRFSQSNTHFAAFFEIYKMI